MTAAVSAQLQEARADLAALEAHTGKLEGNLNAQTTELDRLRRAARAGQAEFEAVVEQQARVTAARGLLDMHLQDVASTAALVDELQAAQTLADLIDDGRTAQAEAVQAAQEHAQLAAELEGLVTDGLTRLQALQGAYSAAHGRAWSAAQRHTARVLGLRESDVSQALTRPENGMGRANQRPVSDALEDFAGQIVSTSRTLSSVAHGTLPALTPGPLLSRVGRV